MSVTNGQLANQTTFNAAFMSRTSNTSTTGKVSITNTEDASSFITGALQVAGGAVIAKNIFCAGLVRYTNVTASSGTTDGALVVSGGVGIGGAVFIGGAISASNLSGTNTGDLTLATVGSSSNTNGASLSGQVLTLQPADSSNPGVMTTGTQSFSGTKSFLNRFCGGIATNSTLTGSNQTVAAPSTILWRFTNSGLVSIDMISSPTANQLILIINKTGNAFSLSNLTGATAANQIITGKGTSLSIANNTSVWLCYDNTSQKWQVIGESPASNNGLNIYNAKDYGALGDGSTDDHTAIQNAINAAEGSTLYIPAGNYVKAQQASVNVPWLIPSNTTIWMDPNCLIMSKLGTDGSEFETPVFRNENYDVSVPDRNIKIIGGKIKMFSNSFSGSTFISMRNVENLFVKDIQLLDIGGWFRVNLIKVTEATFENVKIDYEEPTWTALFVGAGGGVPPTVTQSNQYEWEDGIHIGPGCQDILINNCNINSGDDCIAINVEPDYFGAQDLTDGNLAIKNIVVSNCILKSNHAQCMRLYIHPDIVNTADTVERVFVSNCKMVAGTNGDGIVILDDTEQKLIGEVSFTNIHINATAIANFGIHVYYAVGLLFTNVYVFNAYQRGINLNRCDRVTFTACRIIENQDSTVRNGFYALTCNNVQIFGGEISYFNGSGIAFENVDTGVIEGCLIQNNGVNGILLSGTTNDIAISNNIIRDNTGSGIVETGSTNGTRLSNNVIDNNTGGKVTLIGANSGIPTIRGDKRFQFFMIQIRNNGGTIEHRITSAGGTDGNASIYAGLISNASSTFAATPTVDGSTPFTNGAGINTSNTNELVLDTTAQTAGNAGLAVLGFESTASSGFNFLLETKSRDVNGTTRARTHIRCFLGSTAFALTTANIGSGTELRIICFGYLTEAS